MIKIQVGSPILPDSEFVQDFYDDFRSGLDVSAKHTGSRWSDDFYFDNYELGWGDDAVINRERQKYVSNSDPHPGGWYPFKTGSNGLEIRSRRVNTDDPAEVKYATNKAYDWNDQGQRTRLADYKNGYPKAWGPLVENDPPLFRNYPQKFLGGMLTTRNRHGVNQHRMECRVWFSGGCTMHERYTMRESVFAAVWRLQQVYYMRDLNGDPHGMTHMPYTASGFILEVDDIEFLGHDPYTGHHTVHSHGHDGDPYKYSMKAFSTQYDKPMTDGFHTVTCDVSEVEGVIGFAMDGIYSRVTPMPSEFVEPMKRYKLKAGSTWEVAKDKRGHPIEDGLQERDGKPVYRRQAIIINDASSGGWPRDQMMHDFQDLVVNKKRDYPALPPGLQERVMRIDYIRTAYGKWSNEGDPAGKRKTTVTTVRDIDGQQKPNDKAPEPAFKCPTCKQDWPEYLPRPVPEICKQPKEPDKPAFSIRKIKTRSGLRVSWQPNLKTRKINIYRDGKLHHTIENRYTTRYKITDPGSYQIELVGVGKSAVFSYSK